MFTKKSFPKSLGAIGESLAARYLLSNGYFVLAKNFRTQDGEIDLICLKNGVVIFAEVKTRSSKKYGPGEEAVDEYKLEKIIACGQDFLNRQSREYLWQVDVISIIFNKKFLKATLYHFKNFFG